MHKYYVSYNIDFFKCKAVSAENAEEAIKLALCAENDHQKTLRRMGYIIGDIDVIESSRDGEATAVDDRVQKGSKGLIPSTYPILRERERIYSVGD